MIDNKSSKMKAAMKDMNEGMAIDAVMKKHQLGKIEIAIVLSDERARIDAMLNSAKPTCKKVTLRVFEEDSTAFSAISKRLGESQNMIFHKIIGHYLQSHPKVLAKSDAGK